MASNCKNQRCCRGQQHPQEGNPDFVFTCRNCTAIINRENLGEDGGCAMCGACARMMRRCGHCGRPFGTP